MPARLPVSHFFLRWLMAAAVGDADGGLPGKVTDEGTGVQGSQAVEAEDVLHEDEGDQ